MNGTGAGAALQCKKVKNTRLHALKALIIGLLLSVAVFLPYTPGEYDSFAVAVSAVVQMWAFVSLLFVPVGAVWFFMGLRASAGSGVGVSAGVSTDTDADAGKGTRAGANTGSDAGAGAGVSADTDADADKGTRAAADTGVGAGAPENPAKNGGSQKTFVIAVISTATLTLCAAAATLTALFGMAGFPGSLILGIILLALYILILFAKIIPSLKRIKQGRAAKVSALPLYMIIIPVLALSLRFAFIAPLAEYAKDTAIVNATALIADLEAYHENAGRYPQSIQGLWKDYSTGVRGIERYHYEPNGEAYNLFFEGFSPDIFAREIVMYNKFDEHIIRSHPSFIFSLPPEEFQRYRGYFAERTLPQKHWKYYLFD